MPVITSSDIGDLLRNSLNRLNRGKFTENATDRQNRIFTKNMVRKGKVVFGSGPSFQFNRLTDYNEARSTGLFGVDNLQVKDGMVQPVVRWGMYTTGAAIDHREITRNSGESKIVDMLLTRRTMCQIGMNEILETDAWKVPAATDAKSMFGIPYWVVKNNTEGFNGGAPSGYTDVAGVSPTTDQRWRNWTAQYTSVTKDDLIRKVWKAAEFTRFEPAVDVPDFNTGDEYGHYTNWNVLGTLKEILEAQNDNLGSDLDSMDGRVRFQRAPVQRAVELENDTTNPWYGINWGVFKIATESGWWMREYINDHLADQHTVSGYYTDLSIQPHTYDRRRHFVIATNTGLPA